MHYEETQKNKTKAVKNVRKHKVEGEHMINTEKSAEINEKTQSWKTDSRKTRCISWK